MAILLVIGVSASTGLAAPVDWGTAQDITGNSDVSLDGTLVDAFNLGASGVPAATVNGITFAPFAFPTAFDFQTTATLGNYNFTETSGGFLSSYNNLGTVSGAYSGLSAGYQTLAGSGGSSTFLDTLQLTISGLTIGQTYQFEWWNNNSSQITSSANGYALNTIATADNSISLSANTTATSGGLGQYTIGNFIADDVSQVINFNGNAADPSDPLVNAFQLRDITGVPEPSTWALMIVSFTLLGLTLRRTGRRTTSFRGKSAAPPCNN